MMTCFDDFREETGLFLEGVLCLDERFETSSVLEREVNFREKTFLEDESDVFDEKRKILDIERGSSRDVSLGSSWPSCSPQPFSCGVSDVSLTDSSFRSFPNMLVDLQMFPDMSLCCDVPVGSNTIGSFTFWF